MFNKIIILIIGIIFGALTVVMGNYFFEYYPIDWGATATWGLFIIAIVASTIAYKQVVENRKLKRLDVNHARKLHKLTLTQAYLRDLREIIVSGTANRAQKKVKEIDQTLNVKYDLDIQNVIYFCEELAIMYKENMVNRKLIRIMASNFILDIYDRFETFIVVSKKSSNDKNPFENWEYLVEELRK